MRRDFDLVRDILCTCAKANGSCDATLFTSDTYSIDMVCYHMDMLISAGYATGKARKNLSGSYATATIESLTWQGHDLMANIENDGVWSQTKKTIGALFGTASIPTIQAVAQKIINAHLGI